MADIRPIRGWRYNDNLKENIDSLLSPSFDMISEKQKLKLYKNKLNSIHISVPFSTNRAKSAYEILRDWKKKKIIIQDTLPSFYVYYLYFNLPGREKICRKGFIANTRIHDWNGKVIFKHENTIPSSIEERVRILHSTQMNTSPTHGLYTDPSLTIEKYLDKAIKMPIYDVEDHQGTRYVFSVIHDPVVIKTIIDCMKDKPIILADGHHRYESSLKYQLKKIKENNTHSNNAHYNYHMMYLSNMEGEDLWILPTHRLIRKVENFNLDTLLRKLKRFFTVHEEMNSYNLNQKIENKENSFALIFKEKNYIIQLKANLVNGITWDLPEVIKHMDVTIIHYFILEKCLGIKKEEQNNSQNITYEQNFNKCLFGVENDNYQFCIATKGISIEIVKKIGYSGHLLPQKSTFFYPKIICGFLFSSIIDEENRSAFDKVFNDSALGIQQS